MKGPVKTANRKAKSTFGSQIKSSRRKKKRIVISHPGQEWGQEHFGRSRERETP